MLVDADPLAAPRAFARATRAMALVGDRLTEVFVDRTFVNFTIIVIFVA